MKHFQSTEFTKAKCLHCGTRAFGGDRWRFLEDGVARTCECYNHAYQNVRLYQGKAHHCLLSCRPLSHINLLMIDDRRFWFHGRFQVMCEQYWPSDNRTETYGPHCVKVETEQSLANFTIRTIKLWKKNSTVTVLVIRVHVRRIL